jgi:endonuclease/exonuclease/phosphatase family metal-dependent hydrolase
VSGALPAPPPLARDRTVRVLTYNVHRCVGTDGQLSPERIAAVIARCEPDIVALQELDVGRVRTGGIDQAHAIAALLRMDFHFHPALRVEEELYGDAILTALPVRLMKAGALPGLPDRLRLEPRGALWAAVDVGGTELHVINTHLGLLRLERLRQAAALVGEDWLEHPKRQGPVILLGDFNSVPRSSTYRRLAGRLRDAQRLCPARTVRPTFPSRFPLLRLDHVFVSPEVEVLSATVPRDRLTRTASDHLPLVVRCRLPDG